MTRVAGFWALLLLAGLPASGQAASLVWPSGLPHYDHVVIVVEENKDYSQIIGNKGAPFLNELAREGANFVRFFGEEHPSQGNYFWLLSGSNQHVGFADAVPKAKFRAANLGQQLIARGLSFKGYSESLPAIGAEVDVTPTGCIYPCVYGRKHVPWISFTNVPNGTTPATSANLRFADFPRDYRRLPTVAFVIPDLNHDMHNGAPRESVPRGDAWLRRHLDGYYRWAKTHNSLLIVTFDENDDKSGYRGLTDPAVRPDHDQARIDGQNRIATIFAGAHVKPGYAEVVPLDHVNILRTLEAMYGLKKAGAQQPYAVRAGIADDRLITGVFASPK